MIGTSSLQGSVLIAEEFERSFVMLYGCIFFFVGFFCWFFLVWNSHVVTKNSLITQLRKERIIH